MTSGHAAPAISTVEDISVGRLMAAVDDLHPEGAAALGATRIVRAPGRINIIGEHTDYNDGLVLPAAIDLELRIAYRPTDDLTATLTLLATGQQGSVRLDDLGPRHGDWRDYLAGVAWALGSDGRRVQGFDGVLASTLPIGAGLASSAALELAFAWALSGHLAPAPDGRDLAVLCQRAENDYVGVRCGLMDQYAAANGVRGAAILLDCRTQEHRVVPLPDELALIVAHTGMPRRLDASAYNERRAECQRAASSIARLESSVRSLRDVDEAMLERHRDVVDPVAYQRALHVIRENARVTATAAALASGDLETVGRLMVASHVSLRDRFEVSSPELDAMVEIATATHGVLGARMTGAGFGGCTLTLVHAGSAEALMARLRSEYSARTGLVATVWAVRAVDGAGVVETAVGGQSA
ncbi:MAG TPA: galactokinase [Candidatus Saccharimonadia bacterium]|nr:galactokinase [Candidatus Saccharimonadia bacterium]